MLFVQALGIFNLGEKLFGRSGRMAVCAQLGQGPSLPVNELAAIHHVSPRHLQLRLIVTHKGRRAPGPRACIASKPDRMWIMVRHSRKAPPSCTNLNPSHVASFTRKDSPFTRLEIAHDQQPRSLQPLC